MTVLLVDSDKNALDKIKKYLEERRFAVTVSLHGSGRDAVKFAKHHDVDAVFTRSMLDDMTGQELIDKIKHLAPQAEIRILEQNEEFLLERLLNVFPSAGGKNILDETEKKEGEARKKGGRIMTELDLRGLNRKELLKLMIEQAEEMDAEKEKYERDIEFLKSEHEKDLEFLKEENEKEKEELKKEVEELKNDLQSREIMLDEAGSIAMASLQLNGVFEAAQAACQQYIDNIRSLNIRQTEICEKKEAKVQAAIEQRLKETEQKCSEMQAEAKKKCEAMEKEAKRKAEAYWDEVSKRLKSFYDNHRELKKLLNFNSVH